MTTAAAAAAAAAAAVAVDGEVQSTVGFVWRNEKGNRNDQGTTTERRVRRVRSFVRSFSFFCRIERNKSAKAPASKRE